MVQLHRDVYDRAPGGYPRRGSSYPKLSPETRLQRWFEKVAPASAFMRTSSNETTLTLKRSTATGLGLSSATVTITQEGSSFVLRSSERDCPLAEFSG